MTRLINAETVDTDGDKEVHLEIEGDGVVIIKSGYHTVRMYFEDDKAIDVHQ